MYAKIIEGQIDFYKIPGNVIGDYSPIAISEGYKEVIFEFGDGEPVETETTITIYNHVFISEKKISNFDFFSRFFENEIKAIYTAAKNIIDVEIWKDKFKMMSEIDLNDPCTREALLMLKDYELINENRINEILN